MAASKKGYALFLRGDGGRDVADFKTIEALVTQIAYWGHQFYFSLKENETWLEIVKMDRFGDGHPVLNWTREQGWHDPVAGQNANSDLADRLTIGEVWCRTEVETTDMVRSIPDLMFAIAMGIKVPETDLLDLFDRCTEEFHPDHRVWRYIERT
jgi:hypothetical protein